jgi:TRAP-type C4-dicarboxylate transport system permease small subunit
MDPMDRWDRVDEIIARFEHVFLSGLLGLMILTAFMQILLRNLFSTGFSWGDAFVRYLVLWVGFTGAALATREGKHITIDVFTPWLKGRKELIIQGVVNLFSAVVCGVLTVASVTFVRNEALMGDIGPLGIPGWLLQVILPAAWLLMTVRFARLALKALTGFIRSKT